MFRKRVIWNWYIIETFFKLYFEQNKGIMKLVFLVHMKLQYCSQKILVGSVTGVVHPTQKTIEVVERE